MTKSGSTPSQAKVMLNTIVELEENKKGGSDYVIGDLHGNVDNLKTVLSKLTSKDRLFLVGDFGDRGMKSFATYQLLIDCKNNPNYPEVHSVKGNHELTFRNHYNAKNLVRKNADQNGDLEFDVIFKKMLEAKKEICFISE